MRSARHQYIWVGLFALSVPVILALLSLPTPDRDTRELFDWGHFFSLTTPKHPPMMQWIGGLTERLFAPTAFWAVFVNQLLTLAGLAYVYATLRLLADRDRAAIFTLLLASSVCVVGSPLPYALNADILQFPFWAAIVYHALRAPRTDGLFHWICLALAGAAAFYTKYTVVFLLASLAIASAAVSEYRGIWRDRRLYLSAMILIVLVLPHVLAAPNSGAIDHAGLQQTGASIVTRAQNTGQIVSGVFIYLAPAWIVIAAALLRGDCVIARPAEPAAAKFVRITLLAAFALLILVVTALGHKYPSRYDLPLLFLVVLAAATYIGFDAGRWPATERRILQICTIVPAIVLVSGGLIFGVFTAHRRLQEPAADAAAIIGEDWARHYTCGPAYVGGESTTVHGIAIALKPQAVGVPFSNAHELQWYDPALSKRFGAVVVYPDQIDRAEVESMFPGLEIPEARTLTLPYLRTFAHRSMTYSYFFLPPEGCRAAKEG